MSVVANIAVNLDATQALQGLKGLDGAVKGLGAGIGKVGQAMSGLAGIAAGLGAGAAVGGFIKAGVEADRTAKTIKALAGQYKEVEGVNKLANQAAKQFGLGQTTAAKSVADLYGRLRPMGVSLKDIGTTFTGVNKAAALMNLTSADTEGVMLQLSQAMGSGALQGDELRSIMERLPAVGQAVAKVMGVTVGEVKKLGSDGKITTDVIIKAMNELNKIQAPPPDPYKLFRAALEDLGTTIGTQLLPAFTPLVQKLTEVIAKIKELGVAKTIAEALMPIGQAALGLLDVFTKLPEPVQKFAIGLGAVVIALGLIAVPLGIVVQAIGALIPVVTAVVSALSGLSIFSTIAGWLGALGPAIGAVVTLLSGPVGLVVAIVAVVAAVIAFRKDIAKAFEAVGAAVKDLAVSFYNNLVKPLMENWQGIVSMISTGAKAIFEFLTTPYRQAWEFISTKFIEPIKKSFPAAVQFMRNAFSKITGYLTAPFKAAVGIIKSILNSIIGIIEKAINIWISGINQIIKGANKVPGVSLPTLPAAKLPRFAEGGVVTKPTIALIGEGGEPEYIVPQSKANAFAQNWINDKGGTTTGPSTSSSLPQINVQTGPVMQMNGVNYVTVADMERAMQATAASVFNAVRSSGGRRYAGIR